MSSPTTGPKLIPYTVSGAPGTSRSACQAWVLCSAHCSSYAHGPKRAGRSWSTSPTLSLYRRHPSHSLRKPPIHHNKHRQAPQTQTLATRHRPLPFHPPNTLTTTQYASIATPNCSLFLPPQQSPHNLCEILFCPSALLSTSPKSSLSRHPRGIIALSLRLVMNHRPHSSSSFPSWKGLEALFILA